MKDDIIETLLKNNNHKELKIKLLTKYSKNKIVRKQILNHLEKITKWAEEIDLVSEPLRELIKYEDSIPTIKNTWKEMVTNIPYGWSLVRILAQNPEIKKEINQQLPFLLEITSKKAKEKEENKTQVKGSKYYTANLIEDYINIEGGKKSIIDNFDKIITNQNITNEEMIKIIRIMKNTPKIEDAIIKNFDSILENTKIDISDIINCFEKNPKINQLIKNNLDRVLERTENNHYYSEQIQKILYTVLKNIDFNQEDSKPYHKKLRETYQAILEDENCISGIPPILEEMKKVEGLKDLYEENQYIMENFYEILPSDEAYTKFRKEKSLYNTTIGIIIKENHAKKIKAIVQEMAEGKNEFPKYESNGNFAMTYKINNKRFKIGYEKQIFRIPYHPRIMYPIFRQEYTSKDEKRKLYVEVYEEGENDHENITDEELVQVYLELREAGFFWSDAHKRNLVRLKKDNKLPDWVIKNDHTMFGFIDNNQEHKVLKKGELVICDLDSIYKEIQEGYMDKEGKVTILEFLEASANPCILQAEIEFENRKKEKMEKGEEKEDER